MSADSLPEHIEDARPHEILVLEAYRAIFCDPEAVYYPGCGGDVTPSSVFLQSRITYLDIPDSPIESVRQVVRKVDRVVSSTAEEFEPESSFDLVLSIHSHAPLVSELKDLKSGGHLLMANKMADQAFGSEGLLLVGVFKYQEDGESNVLAVDFMQEGIEKYTEADPEPPVFSFTNARLHQAPFYLFQKQ